MLVLTRKHGEEIRIGDDISIQVVEVKNGRVRLGVTAPSGVGVHRREIYERIKQALADQSEQIEQVGHAEQLGTTHQ